ncbi:MAG: FKBP-type peptidyl-prolyl cis-trans isomerase [Alistipes sp.]|nr:FKBP-type peptidyl-prolyl cis-trans isomerase [Alistipes sp.]
MKRFFALAVTAAVTMMAVACGSNEPKELDTLSYAVGADLGLNLSLGMGDYNLDNDIVIENITDFYENGDLMGEDLQQVRQRMMEFQYMRLMPYFSAKRQRDMITTDMPDTLPALPELYDETFTREDVSAMMGKNMGAYVKSLKTDFDMYWLMAALNDGLKVDAHENIDSLMRISEEQMQKTLTDFAARKREEAIAERERQLVENAEESAKWLSEVEKKKGVQKTESGLLYRIDREGTGAQATEDTDVVRVNYEGKTRTGKVFDSSYERGEAIEFPLNGVIRGWTEGMKLVKEGGQITLWIPSELAYGERGAGADIGPNEALEFKVELIQVTK